MYELVFLTGARAGQTIPVTRTMLAGRSPECQIEVPDPNTSRQHCRIVFDGQEVTVVDNGSSNGTYVNDVRIPGPTPIQPDDVVRIGETCLRLQAAGEGGEQTGSSIFDFKEQEEDLSQSIMLSVADLGKNVQSPQVLAARLGAIIKVSKALVNIHKIDEIFAGILEALFEVFPQADRGFLMIGKEVEELAPKAVRQRAMGETENLSVSTSICKHALKTKLAILFDETKGGDFDQGMSIVNLRIRSAMVVPLLVGEDVLGLLQLDTPDRGKAFTKEDLELAAAVCQQAAIALNNALLLRKVADEATVRGNLMRFLPGPVVQQVIDGQLDLALGGKLCSGTILFSDIIGFTRLSEGLEPESLVRLMNAYFKRMVPCIQRNSGSVDKFMGDAIMAVWGVPINKGDAAANAVTAALSMQNALIGFNSLQARDKGIELSHGIGINTGPLTAGNIGYEQRIEYTVLGDAVNASQRLEAAAGVGQVLVSAATWNELKGAGYAVSMPALKMKNRNEPVETFSMRGLKVGDEILLHLPCRSGSSRVHIIRRLADGNVVLLYPADLDLCAQDLVVDTVEWKGANLGKPVMDSVLPAQDSDGELVRGQVKLADDLLGGLLGEKPPQCPLAWDAMLRSASVLAQ